MTWREAYFVQAQNDYRVFRELKGRSDINMCQKLHYLQMATEKLAKAFLSPPGGGRPPAVHTALVRFLQISKGRPELRRKLGYENSAQVFRSYIDSILDLADRIEHLAPVGAQERPNPEYPWENQAGNVIAPVKYGFSEFQSQELLKFQKLIESLFNVFR